MQKIKYKLITVYLESLSRVPGEASIIYLKSDIGTYNIISEVGLYEYKSDNDNT